MPLATPDKELLLKAMRYKMKELNLQPTPETVLDLLEQFWDLIHPPESTQGYPTITAYCNAQELAECQAAETQLQTSLAAVQARIAELGG